MVRNGNDLAIFNRVLFSGDKPIFAAKRYHSLPYIAIYGFSILKQPVLNIRYARQFVKWILPQL